MSANKATQHHREVLQSITNLQVCGVSSPFKTASPAGAQNTSAGQCNLFAMLPHDVVHTVLAQLANDTRSLQNLTRTCRAFASLFRGEDLWHKLISERWGSAVALCCKDRQSTMQELHCCYAMRRPVQQTTKDNIVEHLADFFGPVPSGTYQLHLHKQQHKCLHELAFGVDISSSSSNSSNRHELTVYYELMYDAETTITTQPFHLDPCSTYCHILKPPSGLQSVQLHKLRQGDLIRVSPEFTSASPSLRYPEENVSAGVDDKGSPLFISVRFGSHAELGRSSESGRFIYGRYGSYREEIAPHKNFQGKAAWPGILVNLSCYTWITTTMQHVGSLKERAVHLGQAEDGSLHAVRVLFRGWHKATLPSGQRLAIMQTTGPIISVLPGKFVFGQGGPDYAMFTYKGRATGGPEVRLGDGQEFQLLCYRVFQG